MLVTAVVLVCIIHTVATTILKSHRLREAREAQGLSMRELAHFADCSHTTVARLEHGNIDVAPALKARIARALRVPVSTLWPVEHEQKTEPVAP